MDTTLRKEKDCRFLESLKEAIGDGSLILVLSYFIWISPLEMWLKTTCCLSVNGVLI